MKSDTERLAEIRFDNAMALFDEFVHSNVKHADAATLRGLEGRFAVTLQIQPSYWSQLKARTRQIGEHLARQFERLCQKPAGWLDEDHQQHAVAVPHALAELRRLSGVSTSDESHKVNGLRAESSPRDDDEAFITGLVLTYYRRHPERARARLLDLIGEVLAPSPPLPTAPLLSSRVSQKRRVEVPQLNSASRGAAGDAPVEDARTLWARTQAGVAPLKRKR